MKLNARNQTVNELPECIMTAMNEAAGKFWMNERIINEINFLSDRLRTKEERRLNAIQLN